MKASLYAIRVNQEWSWQASLNESIDLAFLYRQKPEILRLEPLLSWGQALWLKAWMNERSDRFKASKLTEVRGELIKALTVIKANPDLLQKLELRLWDRQGYRQHDRKSNSMGWVSAMQSRSLLPNEWI